MRSYWGTCLILSITLIGMSLLASTLSAQVPRNVRAKPPEKPSVMDLLLGRDGSLEGQLSEIDSEETAAVPKEISIWQGQKLIWKGTADESGKFRLKNIPTGLYRVVHGDDSLLFRAWATETAPPKSSGSLIINRKKRVFDFDRVTERFRPANPIFPPVWSATHGDPVLPSRP